jgi:hypothetical protein
VGSRAVPPVPLGRGQKKKQKIKKGPKNRLQKRLYGHEAAIGAEVRLHSS